MTGPTPSSERPRRPLAAARLLLALAAVASPAVATAAPLADPASLLERIRSMRLEPERAVAVDSLAVELAEATLDIESGVLIPSEAVAGRTLQFVFVGRARFRLDPPDEIEAGQLELFTGSRALDAPVESAVLLLADDDAAARLLDRAPPEPLHPATLERARAIHDEWLEKTGPFNVGIDAALFKVLAGDRAYRSYFALWCDSYELGRFVFQFDPDDVEQLTLADFEAVPIQGWARERLRRAIRKQQRKGRYLGVTFEDLGAWDVWLSTRTGPQEGPRRGGFESQHYELDVTVLPRRDRRIDATATIDILAVEGGRRTVSLELFRDLRVEDVRDGDGRELFFFQTGEEVVVLLDRAPEVGERLRLRVDYEGLVLRWVASGVWDLDDTANWYPHCGLLDRATYDVTYRWPRRDSLYAGGRLVGEGRDGGLRWERRVLDTPAIAASFVVGRFVEDRIDADGVAVRVAYARRSPRRLTRDVRDGMAYSVVRSLEFFETRFGEYPLDELTVAVLPREERSNAPDAQSLLGFITFDDDVLLGGAPWNAETADWPRDTTIAHEIAHQWWGNLVGWSSYRDQWLSEGMANYAAMLYWAAISGEDEAFLASLSAGWRDSLAVRNSDGRRIDSLGPIVLGPRLNSTRAGNAYGAIVYRKGAVVLTMLARAFGEETFVRMLGELAAAGAGQPITTEMFLTALERMSGLELDGFARQFVYGTGIPRVVYEQRVEPADDGGWILRGSARQVAEPSWGQSVVRTASGWDVRRVPDVATLGRPSTLVVPFRIPVDTGAPPGRRPRYRVGRLLLDPAEESFEIPSPLRPLGLDLDPRGEVFAHFFSRARHPKRAARLLADDLAARGLESRAESAYRDALALPPDDGPLAAVLPWLRNPVDAAAIEDAGIRLSLARLALDEGRDDEARGLLDEVEARLADVPRAFEVRRQTLRGRLELRAGDYEAVHRRLRRSLREIDPQDGPITWRGFVRRLELNAERLAMNEAWGMLAAASRELDERDDLEWALREARRRGVDVAAIESSRESHEARRTAAVHSAGE